MNRALVVVGKNIKNVVVKKIRNLVIRGWRLVVSEEEIFFTKFQS